MPQKRTSKASSPRGRFGPEEVALFLAALEHPHKDALVAIRRIILEADSDIAEGIKWNAPSFRTSEWFATFHLRAKEGVQVILHLGAKVRADTVPIADPQSLLAWLGRDRASVSFRDVADVEAKGPALTEVIRQWIRHVQPG